MTAVLHEYRTNTTISIKMPVTAVACEGWSVWSVVRKLASPTVCVGHGADCWERGIAEPTVYNRGVLAVVADVTYMPEFRAN